MAKRSSTRDDDLEAVLQGYIQRQANPDRIGCPTVEQLEAFLEGQPIQDDPNAVYEHLTHCRECLLELRTLRDLRRESAARLPLKRRIPKAP